MNPKEIRIFKYLRDKVSYDMESKIFSISVDKKNELMDKFVVFNEDIGDLFVDAMSFYSDAGSMQTIGSIGITNDFIKDTSFCLRKELFSAPHMVEIPPEMHNVPPKSSSLFRKPDILPEIPLLIFKADKMMAVQTGGKADKVFPRAYGTHWNMPLSVVTGIHSGGITRNLEKMSSNKFEMDPELSDSLIISAITMLAYDTEVPQEDIDKVVYDIPGLEVMTKVLKGYKTSPGYVPLDNVQRISMTNDGEVVIKKGLPKTKDALAEVIAQLMFDRLTELKTKCESGEQFDRVWGASISVSALKYEILNASKELTYKDMKALHSKIRVFFIEGMHQVLLSHTVWLPIFNYLSRKGFEIGTKMARGGFLEIWKIHACSTEGYVDPKIEEFYQRYPFMRQREYGEADISSFDQSLIYKLLMASASYLGMFYNMKGSGLTRTVVSDCMFRLVFKYLYLVQLDSLYLVYGMMFSGKYETSHCNTVYQNIVYFMYISYVLDKYKDDKCIHILKEAIELGLFSRSYSGDDLFYGWPVWMRLRYNIHIENFKEFASKVGLTFKYCKTRPLFAKVLNTKYETGVYTTELLEEGVSFLKNMMARNYTRRWCKESQQWIIDEKCEGIYPFRPMSDLALRIGNSDKANSKIDGYLAKLLSILYLSFGNREVYSYVSILYRISAMCYGWKGGFNFEDMEYVFKGSGFMIQASEQVKNFSGILPKIEELRLEHDKGYSKYKKLLIPYSEYYVMQLNKESLDILFDPNLEF